MSPLRLHHHETGMKSFERPSRLQVYTFQLLALASAPLISNFRLWYNGSCKPPRLGARSAMVFFVPPRPPYPSGSGLVVPPDPCKPGIV
jgi:hypothetical protein